MSEVATLDKLLLNKSHFDREAFLSAYRKCAISNLQLAVPKLLKAIELILKDKKSAEPEVLELYNSLGCTEADSLVKCIECKLLPKYHKIEYMLRVFTLRSMMFDDLSINLDDSLLIEIAGDHDFGRLAVLDFLLSREPKTTQLHTVKRIFDDLDDKEYLKKKEARYNAILSLIGTTVDLTSYTTGEQISKNHDIILRADKKSVTNWIEHLDKLYPNKGDREAQFLSICLTNLAAKCENAEIRCRLFNFALEFDNPVPSKHFFKKFRRVILGTASWPGQSERTLQLGLDLTAQILNLEQWDFTDLEYLGEFSTVLSAIYTLSDLNELVQAILNCKMPSLWSQVFMVLLPYNPGTGLDTYLASLLMNSAVANADTDLKIRLVHCYVSLTGESFTLESLVPSTNDQRIILSIAEAMAQQDPVERYEIIKNAVNFPESSINQALVDFLQNNGYQHLLICLGQPLELLMETDLTDIFDLQTRKQAVDLGFLEGMRLLVSNYTTLMNHGCHMQALWFLKNAVKTSRKYLGLDNVFELSLQSLLEHFMLLSNLDASQLDQAGYDCYTEVGIDMSLMKEVDALISSISLPLKWFLEWKGLFNQFKQQIGLSTSSGIVLADPPLVGLDPQNHKNSENDKFSQNLLQQLSSIAPHLNSGTWLQRVEVVQNLQWLEIALHHKKFNFDDYFDCEKLNLDTELVSQLVNSNRLMHSQTPPPTLINNQEFKPPKNTICIQIEFDQSAIKLCRYDREFKYMVRIPLNHSLGLTTPHTTIHPQQAQTQISEILNKSSPQIMQEPNSRLFWKAQKQLDSELAEYLFKLEESWFGGFRGMLADSDFVTDKRILAKFETAIAKVLVKYLRPLKIKPSSLKISPLLINLFIHCSTFDDYEDVCYALIDSLKLQTTDILRGCIDFPPFLDELTTELHLLKQKYELPRLPIQSSNQPRLLSPTPTINAHQRPIILIVDRQCNNIPWESFYLFHSTVITRAMSLNQVSEWLAQSKQVYTPPTYILNPGNDLKHTEQHFMPFFKSHNWHGIHSKPPTEPQFVTSIQTNSSLIYIGHGSGNEYIRRTLIRELYLTKTAALLFGCKSLAVNSIIDNDSLMDYSIAGSNVIMGNLWNVKDKDSNRFTETFLTKLFDEKMPIGEALLTSRSQCVLRYITAAAPVVYGLPL